MRLGVFGLVGAAWFAMGCGAEPGGAGEPTADGDNEQVAVQTEFLNWSTSQTLLSEHTAWHLGGCGAPGARSCPTSGAEFMRFHRNFLSRLRDDALAKGVAPAELTAWQRPYGTSLSAFPDEIRATSTWSFGALGTVEARVQSFKNDNNARFASLEEFGTYVEGRIHNYLHGAAQEAYPNDSIGAVTMSPASTYFFKIHGWVEWQFLRFQLGDFTQDGHSELISRSPTTGGNRLQPMVGRAPSGNAINLPTYADDACHYYVGATADLNYDGTQDIIWHGPGCGTMRVMLMASNGTTQLGLVQQTGMDSNHTLLGAADFDQDLRPDLVWRRNSDNSLWYWKMKGWKKEVLIGPTGVSAGNVPVAVADVDNNSTPDVIYERVVGSNKEYYYKKMKGFVNVTGSFIALTDADAPQGTVLKTPATYSIGAIGRFQDQVGGSNSVADIVFNQPNGVYSFACGLGSGSYSLKPGGTLLTSTTLVQGPR